MLRPCLPVFLVIVLATAPASAGFFDRGVKGSGDLTTTTLDLDAIVAVELECGLDIDIDLGKQQRVALTMDDNLVEYYDLQVRDGVLMVSTDKSTRPSRKAHLELTLRELERVEVAGAGDITIDRYDGEALAIIIDGAGDIEATGKVKNLQVEVDGAGDISADGLKAQHATVKINGAGDVEVYASKSCDVTINGVGDVDVHGQPDDYHKRVNGIGQVTRK
jgi:hypothetical protein